jgi:hypothetical protein
MSLYKVSFYVCLYNRNTRKLVDKKPLGVCTIVEKDLHTAINRPDVIARQHKINTPDNTYMISHYDVTEYVYNPFKGKLQLDYTSFISGSVH